MMILIKRILQMIHLVIRRKSHHQKKKALNQRMRKMKLRMISNHLQNPLTMKNLLLDALEEAVFTLLMKNLRKVVTTAVNLTKDYRAIPMIRLKNLNQNLVHQDHVCRSSRVPKPIFKYGSAYGDKPAVQIEKEIRSERAWQRAIEPKAKAMIKQAHNTFHDDLETLVKEGGNKSIHYLLAQAVDIEKNPRELHYRNILRLKISNQKV